MKSWTAHQTAPGLKWPKQHFVPFSRSLSLIFPEILAPESSKDVDRRSLGFSRTGRCLISSAVSGAIDTPALLGIFTVSLLVLLPFFLESGPRHFWKHYSPLLQDQNKTVERTHFQFQMQCNWLHFMENANPAPSGVSLLPECSSLAYFVGNLLKRFLDFATKRAFEPYILLIVTEYQCWPSD